MNQQIFLYLNNFAGHSLLFDTLIIFCATYLGMVFLAFIFLHESFLKNNSWTEKRNNIALLILMIIGAFIVWNFGEFINRIFPVARPSSLLPQSFNLIGRVGFDSFPSGHTVFFFTLAFLFYKNYKSYFYAGLVVAILTGLFRIIGGAHYPTDILGGIILAFIGTYILNFSYPKIASLFK